MEQAKLPEWIMILKKLELKAKEEGELVLDLAKSKNPSYQELQVFLKNKRICSED